MDTVEATFDVQLPFLDVCYVIFIFELRQSKRRRELSSTRLRLLNGGIRFDKY